MRNKLLRMIRQYDMIMPGDTVVCAVSGGADSVALLFAMYLLRDRLDIRLEAAHFNYTSPWGRIRRDEALSEFRDAMISFTRRFGGGSPGEKGAGSRRPGRPVCISPGLKRENCHCPHR